MIDLKYAIDILKIQTTIFKKDAVALSNELTAFVNIYNSLNNDDKDLVVIELFTAFMFVFRNGSDLEITQFATIIQTELSLLFNFKKFSEDFILYIESNNDILLAYNLCTSGGPYKFLEPYIVKTLDILASSIYTVLIDDRYGKIKTLKELLQ